MKTQILILLFLPGPVFAQKYNFQGEYQLANITERRAKLKAKDTMIESFNFRDDSVKIGYEVMRPDIKTFTKHTRGYLKWKITRQEKSSETDKASRKEIVYEQLDVTLSDGGTIGYFQYASSLDEQLRRTLPQGLIFIHDGRKFIKSGSGNR